jgi:hypothetical protein
VLDDLTLYHAAIPRLWLLELAIDSRVFVPSNDHRLACPWVSAEPHNDDSIDFRVADARSKSLDFSSDAARVTAEAEAAVICKVVALMAVAVSPITI